MPQGVREVIGRRLARLSDACNAALRIAAVLGRDFDTRLLERAAELPEEELLEGQEAQAAQPAGDPRGPPAGGQVRRRPRAERLDLHQENPRSLDRGHDHAPRPWRAGPEQEAGSHRKRLDLFAEAGFDEAVVIPLPGGPATTEVRSWVESIFP